MAMTGTVPTEGAGSREMMVSSIEPGSIFGGTEEARSTAASELLVQENLAPSTMSPAQFIAEAVNQEQNLSPDSVSNGVPKDRDISR